MEANATATKKPAKTAATTTTEPSAKTRLITTGMINKDDVEFQDIYYAVKDRGHFIKSSNHRNILRGVSGRFRNGQLAAIMGPSGAGKSSLLNAISGYRKSGVTGHMKVNCKDSCYITQEDNHQTLVTVQELMIFACNLKCKNSPRKREIVTEILDNLMLSHCRDVTANRLSGGERKRLSIALEMVANPDVFFLDEPTSGLDEVTAAQCISLLRNLAMQGRTIVCTIHQPSPTIFNYFDHVYVLARGLCVYQGSPAALLPFLTHLQFECPKHYSPSDYIIELCDGEDGKCIPTLSNTTENGKLFYASNQSETSWAFQQAVTTLFVDKPQRNRFHAILTSSSRGSMIEGATVLFEHMKSVTKQHIQTESTTATSYRATTQWQQFFIIARMMFLRITRARIALFIQFAHHILCGVFFGLIFYNAANDGDRMFDHLKFCIASVLMIVYTQVMVPILDFPGEVKLMKKETFNRWYSLTPYYFALNVSRIPLQVILNLAFLSIIYWMTGLPQQWWRFALFAAVGLMTSFVSEGLGLAVGSSFNIVNGTVVGPSLIAPFTFLAVYGLDFSAQIPFAMDIFLKFSFMRVSVMGFVLSLFGFDRAVLDCMEFYCHFADPKVLLQFVGAHDISLLHQFLILTGIMIFFRTLLYLGLRRRCSF